MVIRPIVLAATLAVAALGTTTVTAQVYKETVSGHNGPMTVEVTIEKGAVKAVKVLKHSERGCKVFCVQAIIALP